MSTSVCVRYRYINKTRDGDVIEYPFSIKHSAVSVRRVLAETDVCNYGYVCQLLANCTNRRLYGGFGIGGSGTVSVLVCWKSEKQHSADAIVTSVSCFENCLVNGQLVYSGHGWDLSSHAVTFADEQRINEVARGHTRFADEIADSGRTTKSPRSITQNEQVCFGD